MKKTNHYQEFSLYRPVDGNSVASMLMLAFSYSLTEILAWIYYTLLRTHQTQGDPKHLGFWYHCSYPSCPWPLYTLIIFRTLFTQPLLCFHFPSLLSSSTGFCCRFLCSLPHLHLPWPCVDSCLLSPRLFLPRWIYAIILSSSIRVLSLFWHLVNSRLMIYQILITACWKPHSLSWCMVMIVPVWLPELQQTSTFFLLRLPPFPLWFPFLCKLFSFYFIMWPSLNYVCECKTAHPSVFFHLSSSRSQV